MTEIDKLRRVRDWYIDITAIAVLLAFIITMLYIMKTYRPDPCHALVEYPQHLCK